MRSMAPPGSTTGLVPVGVPTSHRRGAGRAVARATGTAVVSAVEPDEVALLHKPALERAFVHLECPPIGDARIVERARIGLAGLHVEDPDDLSVDVEERDRQGDQR